MTLNVHKLSKSQSKLLAKLALIDKRKTPDVEELKGPDFEVLQDMGIVDDKGELSDRGMCFAVLQCKVSFTKYIRANPYQGSFWENAMGTTRHILKLKAEKDAFYSATIAGYLQMNLFYEDGSFKLWEDMTYDDKIKQRKIMEEFVQQNTPRRMKAKLLRVYAMFPVSQ